MIKKPELLAPAGDLERLKVALHYGADAVYVGGPSLGLRANAINFTLKELEEGVKYAHNLNKKVYVTVNIILHEKEESEVLPYLKNLEKIGVDAIIVSDPYIIYLAKKNTNLEIHLSTQQSAMNVKTVSFFKQQGVSRVVLAREVSKENIKEIKDSVDIELECFIHGAMCASVSGRCVLSNFLTNRDANRGGCSQICRWDFDLTNDQGVAIKGDKPFTFCSKDLSMITKLKEMIELNVSSFKIEGRMRSIYYIATVVSVYRKAIDRYFLDPLNYKASLEEEFILRRCANRDSVVQFFDGTNDESCGYYNGREEVSNQDFIGLILEYDEKEKMALVEQRNYFEQGDEVTIFGPKHEDITYTIKDIFDDDKKISVVNHPRQIVKIPIDFKVEPLDIIRKCEKMLDN